MDRRSRNLFLVILVVVIGLIGAVVFLQGGPPGADPVGPPGAQAEVGVIVGVDSGGLDKVTGFLLRTPEQDTFAFVIGDLDNGARFPPGHLVEHQATAQPVRVWYRTENGERVAVRLEDAS